MEAMCGVAITFSIRRSGLSVPGGSGSHTSMAAPARRPFFNASISASGRSWEFPVVVKHKLLVGPVRPYFEAGLSFQHLSDIRLVGVNHNSNCGIVAGGGLELRLGASRISPEIRYTGWTLRNFDSVVQSHRNQVTLLFGIGF